VLPLFVTLPVAGVSELLVTEIAAVGLQVKMGHQVPSNIFSMAGGLLAQRAQIHGQPPVR
jgi:hypothetical protein